MKTLYLPKYAARRFAGKATLVREEYNCGHHALLRATRPFRAWKKVRHDSDSCRYRVISLTIPKGALLWCHEGEAKCRADKVISRGEGASWYGHNAPTLYKRGRPVIPSAFTKVSRVCAPGIHFFASKSAATRYHWS